MKTSKEILPIEEREQLKGNYSPVIDRAIKALEAAEAGRIEPDPIEIIKKGFEFLKKDCSSVVLAGFTNKCDIPAKSTIEEYDKAYFDHEFSDTTSDGFDDGNFWGDIYLPLQDDIYMRFEIHA